MPLVDYEGYNISDWGGYDEEPITPETVDLAQSVAALVEQKPDDAPGGDGSIGFEWRNGDDILCLDVDSDGGIRMYGTIKGKFYRSATNPS